MYSFINVQVYCFPLDNFVFKFHIAIWTEFTSRGSMESILRPEGPNLLFLNIYNSTCLFKSRKDGILYFNYSNTKHGNCSFNATAITIELLIPMLICNCSLVRIQSVMLLNKLPAGIFSTYVITSYNFIFTSWS